MKEISKEEFTKSQRSLAQNRSLHAYCEDIAREATNAGIEVQAFVKNTGASITPALVKEIWRAIGKVKFGKEHTSELTTKEFTEVYEEVNKHISQWGLEVSFPSWADITYTK